MDAICVENLRVIFHTEKETINAVDDVSFSLRKGEILGIAGESGSGKSTIAAAIMGLVHPEEGHIYFNGRDLTVLRENEMREIRGQHIALINQEFSSALNPFRKIAPQMRDAISAHSKTSRKEAEKHAEKMLGIAGLESPRTILEAYPHQLSGGMKQRVMIAIALSQGADILIADEATASLDVTIQAQIIEVLKNLNRTMGTSIIFISHNLDALETIAGRIMIMYSGRIAEIAGSRELFTSPMHPYTEALIAASPKPFCVPSPIPGRMERNAGTFSSCLFAARCPERTKRCLHERPPVFRKGERYISCWERCDE